MGYDPRSHIESATTERMSTPVKVGASPAAQLVKNRRPVRSQRAGRDCVTEHTGRILNTKIVSGSNHMLLKAKHFLSLRQEGGNRKVIQREVKHEKASVHCCWL